MIITRNIPTILISLIAAILLPRTVLHAQDHITTPDINQRLELTLDSIRQTTVLREDDQINAHDLFWTVKNLTEDTIEFITNSCFYYNNCTLQYYTSTYDLNASGGCLYNSLESHLIPPGGAFSYTDDIFGEGIDSLPTGTIETTLTLYLVQDSPNSYRIDGRQGIERTIKLKYFGPTQVVAELRDFRKSRGKKKTLRN